MPLPKLALIWISVHLCVCAAGGIVLEKSINRIRRLRTQHILEDLIRYKEERITLRNEYLEQGLKPNANQTRMSKLLSRLKKTERELDMLHRELIQRDRLYEAALWNHTKWLKSYGKLETVRNELMATRNAYLKLNRAAGHANRTRAMYGEIRRREKWQKILETKLNHMEGDLWLGLQGVTIASQIIEKTAKRN